MSDKYTIIAGVDEAGRGPLAGPVVAGAVHFPKKLEASVLKDINDSKKLTAKKREELYYYLVQNVDFGVGIVDNDFIDKKGIRLATFTAMQQAVAGLSITPHFLKVDGRDNFPFNIPCEFIIKGDAKEKIIGAASIIAKVTRDNLMKSYAEQYPQYGFAQHKGYGTAMHRDMIKQHGFSPIHRQSFKLKELESSNLKNK